MATALASEWRLVSETVAVTEEQEIAELLKKLNVDQSFVVEAEHRPQLGIEGEGESIPEIDLSPFLKSLGDTADPNPVQGKDDPALARLVAEIGGACEKWGFFQVVNHGVAPELVKDLQVVAAQFFDLPLEEKRKILRTLERPLGYYDYELTKNKRDWKEVFDFTCRETAVWQASPAEDNVKDDYASWSNQWPEKPSDFQTACRAYAGAVEGLARQLLGLISLSLGLPFDRLHTHFGDRATASVRLNYYPPCPVPDLALGVSRHKDPGALTVLVQDEVGGLQVQRRDGKWISVRPRQDAFIINLGDLFQVWSNDKYRSVEHRVVVNRDRSRFSFPLFFNPSVDTEVHPLPELLAGDQPRYRSFSWGYYIKTRSDGNYKQMGEDLQIRHFAI